MKPRYSWWVALGLALLFGYAILHLPRRFQMGAAIATLAIAFLPVNFDTYRHWQTASPPFRAVFSWFAEHLRPGDVLVIDPHCTCGAPYGWDYFVPQFFPSGDLPVADQPGRASRVWYLSNDGWKRDEQLFRAVRQGRKAREFVGPWFFLLRLYEGPPSWDGALFGDKIRFNGSEIPRTGNVVADNEQFTVHLWWSVDKPVDRDYSMSLAVLNPKGKLIAQSDGPPQAPDTPGQTSQWQPGQYYEDFRTIQLRRGLRNGEYKLVLTVYQWWDGATLKPADNASWPRTGDRQKYILLQKFKVVNIDSSARDDS